MGRSLSPIAFDARMKAVVAVLVSRLWPRELELTLSTST